MKVMNIVGDPPQFIKVSPIFRSMEQHNLDHSDRAIQEILVHTGQHYDHEMWKVFCEEFDPSARISTPCEPGAGI